MLNKPTGVVSSMKDENGRPDLREFTRQYQERLFNVGRLDAETSGLLLLTNDGELAHVLAHPSFGVTKTYIATVRGRRDAARPCARSSTGIELEDGPIAADRARIVGESSKDRTLVELTLHSGRNRIVRRMLDARRPSRCSSWCGASSVRCTWARSASGRTRDLTKVELGQLLTIARAGARRDRRARTRPMNDRRLAEQVRIVGSGLLGASIGLGLRAHGVDVILEDASPSARNLAIDYGAGRRACGRRRPRL